MDIKVLKNCIFETILTPRVLKSIISNLYLVFLSLFFSAHLCAQKLAYQTTMQKSKPFLFMENKGQLADEKGNVLSDIKYYAKSNGVNIYCKNDRIAFVFTRVKEHNKLESAKSGGLRTFQKLSNQKNHIPDSTQIDAARIEMQFVNANPVVQVIQGDQDSYFENYYLAQCSNGITAKGFKQLTYKNLWPKIDLVLKISQNNGMEYSLIIYPGGNIKDIQFRWNGADLNFQNKEIIYSNLLGNIKEAGINSFLKETNEQIEVSYNRLGVSVLGFNAVNYDQNKALIIDPELIWATYYAGSSGAYPNNSSSDTSGNIFITGFTQSTSLIATTGAYMTSGGSSVDVFLAKFSKSGKLLWGTYYGGGGDDWGYGVATDISGNVYITGAANSPGMATSGAYKTSSSGGSDAYLAKFNTSGSLIWATYYGGNDYDEGYGLATDPSGNIYITGFSASTNGIATSGAYRTSPGTYYFDAFLAKFSSSGSLQWGTYFGGDQADIGSGISIDASRNIFLFGITTSSNGIATSGAYRTSFAGGQDVFLAKFSNSGSLKWATYYGGSDLEYAKGITCDVSGNIYITGGTTSSSGIATTGANQALNAGSLDGFIAQFANSGSLNWATYYGGSKDDMATGICIDVFNNIYIAGYTYSSAGIATSSAYQTTYAGNEDAFLAKFTSTGKFSIGTYFGASGTDVSIGTSLGDMSSVYIFGNTSSTSNIATSGAYQTSSYNSNEVFVAKFLLYFQNDAGILSVLSPNTNTSICEGSKSITVQLRNFGSRELDSVKINWSLNGKLQVPYKWTGALAKDKDTLVTIGTFNFSAGIDTIKAWTSMPNGKIDSVPLNDSSKICDTIVAYPTPNAGGNKSICKGDSIKIGASSIGGHSYSWTSNPLGYSSTLNNPTVKPAVTTVDYLTETTAKGGCSKVDSVKITVNPLPNFKATSSHTICSGTNFNIGGSGVSGNTYSWNSKPSGFSSTFSNPIVSPTINTTYYLTETISNTGCSQSDTTFFYVLPIPTANAGGNNTICYGVPINIGISAVNGHAYLWTSNPKGFTASTSKLIVKPVLTTTYSLIETITATGCSSRDSAIILVNPLPNPYAGGNHSICFGSSIQIGDKLNNGLNYSWASNPNGFNSTLNNPTVNPAISTYYFLTETIKATGCSKTDTAIITVNPNPGLDAGINHSHCKGRIVNIGGPPAVGHTYSWSSLPQGFTSSVSNPSPIPDTTTTYYLTEIITSTGCRTKDSVIVTVNPLPNANTGGDKPMCFGSKIQLGDSALKGHLYSWTSSPAGFTSTIDNPLVSPKLTTSYYLEETIVSTSCSRVDTTIITVNPIPGLDAGGNHTVCKGSSVLLGSNPVAGNNYSWTSIPVGFTSTLSNPRIIPDTNTTYHLTETIANTGCTRIDSAIITLKSVPIPHAGNTQTVCAGKIIYLGDSAKSGYLYKWTSNPPGFSSFLRNPVDSPTVNSEYYLTETLLATGCSKTDSVAISVNPLPTANAGKNQSICQGFNTQIGGSPISGHSYVWSSVPQAGFASAISNPNVKPATSTLYYLVETNTATGCSKMNSVFVKVNPLPSPVAGNPQTICDGSKITIGYAGTSGDTYQWSSGPIGFNSTLPNDTVSPSISSTYILTEKDATTGCSNVDSTRITVNPKPGPIISGVDKICGNDSSYNFQVVQVNGSSWVWNINGGKIVGGQGTNSPFIKFDYGIDTIKVIETNTFGCSGSTSKIVNVRLVPNAHFTTSYDGNIFTYKTIDSTEQVYVWSLGDGATSNLTKVMHQYSFDKDSIIKISLLVNSTFGCLEEFDTTLSIPSHLFNIKLYPNPFENSSKIDIVLDKASHVKVIVYDAIGKQITTLVDANQSPGIQTYIIDASHYKLSNGAYFLKIFINDKVYIRSLIKD